MNSNEVQDALRERAEGMKAAIASLTATPGWEKDPLLANRITMLRRDEELHRHVDILLRRLHRGRGAGRTYAMLRLAGAEDYVLFVHPDIRWAHDMWRSIHGEGRKTPWYIQYDGLDKLAMLRSLPLDTRILVDHSVWEELPLEDIEALDQFLKNREHAVLGAFTEGPKGASTAAKLEDHQE